jgi:general secretion pathway protein K
MNPRESRRWRYGDEAADGARPRRQVGAAAVAALLLAALVAALGGAILLSQETWIAQAVHQNDRLTARGLARIGVHWARAILYDDRSRSSADHLGEAWAQNMQPIEMDGATISGHIEDAEGRFDLNSLVVNGKRDAEALAIYARLLGMLDVPAELAQSLADWEDADDETADSGGAENYYYLALAQPYRAANAPLAALDELQWIKGYSPEAIARLTPYVTVLPAPASINANTASAEVLAAATGMSLSAAQQFVAGRVGKPLQQAGDLSVRLPAATGGGRLGVSSRYFIVDGVVRKGAARMHLEALLDRDNSGWPTIVWLRQR